MKKEFANIMQLVEAKYGFDKCEKTEFVKQMTKEFIKYEKKLAKIQNYQQMEQDGKTLSKEVLEFIQKKQSFIDHINSLKNVTDVYVKTSSNHTDAVLKALKEEVERKETEFREKELKKLADFFVVAEMLKEKDHISPTPLIKVPKEKQEVILTKYIELVRLTHNKDTTMNEEAVKLKGLFDELLKNEEMKTYVEKVMENAKVADVKFKISEGPEYEFVMLQPADRLEMSDQVKIEDKTRVVKANLPLKLENEAKQEFCPVQKQEGIVKIQKKEVRLEECKEEIVKESMEALNLEHSERIINNESIPPSLIDLNQESEFEIAMSKGTRRELNRKLKEQEIIYNSIKSVDIKEINEEDIGSI